jgi:hypothetical protein
MLADVDEQNARVIAGYRGSSVNKSKPRRVGFRKFSHKSFELFLMLANANTVLIGKKVVLVPYEAEHVPVSSFLLIDLYADRE